MTALALESVSKTFPSGTVAVDALDLSVSDGEVMVLLGPSGCGKSTILRMVAGLEDPTDGLIRFDGEIANRWSPRERRVAMAFQDFALYPHMSVRGNLGFPLKLARQSPETVSERVADLAAALGVADTLERRPGQLSGGQKQRVAMGRAIIREPRVFLLDEPLSNLDSALRQGLRAEISSLVRSIGVTTIYVTHDQTEALTMADRVAILRDGRIEQLSTPHGAYRAPESLFVAAFLGTPRMNLLWATVYAYLDDRLLLDLGHQHVALPWSDPRVRDLVRYHGEQVIVGLRAEAVTPVGADHAGALRGIVRYAEHLGHETIAYLDVGGMAAGLDELTGTGHEAVMPVESSLRRWWRSRRDGPAEQAPDPEPVAEADPGRHEQQVAEFALRLPPYAAPKVGEIVAMHADLSQLHVFDRNGRRINTRGALSR
ncbi:ABC transporter ATP-binding protein [Actinocatenispora comari]|uniref:Sugar ABC transporter ATP-binding protein n=1 Tax=Actinocatenispora comari TaxID=2807577 RepID=A0A8J4ACM3_9ACTN|nr:ABC transporter ATP-binding protein [Actinocatenispora comari]GIL27245.1 sugar ABC transporter ATP-binding protein [Actinocatenispora comari]